MPPTNPLEGKEGDPEALMGIAGGLEFVSEAEMKLTQNKFKPPEDQKSAPKQAPKV